MGWGSEISAYTYVAWAWSCSRCEDGDTDLAEHEARQRADFHVRQHELAWADWSVLDLRELTDEQRESVFRKARRR